MGATATRELGTAAPHLKEWRLARGMTRRELAHKAGIAQNTLRRAEEGGAVIGRTLERLANALNATRSELILISPTAEHARPARRHRNSSEEPSL